MNTVELSYILQTRPLYTHAGERVKKRRAKRLDGELRVRDSREDSQPCPEPTHPPYSRCGVVHRVGPSREPSWHLPHRVRSHVLPVFSVTCPGHIAPITGRTPPMRLQDWRLRSAYDHARLMTATTNLGARIPRHRDARPPPFSAHQKCYPGFMIPRWSTVALEVHPVFHSEIQFLIPLPPEKIFNVNSTAKAHSRATCPSETKIIDRGSLKWIKNQHNTSMYFSWFSVNGFQHRSGFVGS